MEEKHKPMDFGVCDYDEGFSRLEASDIGGGVGHVKFQIALITKI